MTGTLYLVEYLGFIVSTKKSVLNPAQEIEFLGLSGLSSNGDKASFNQNQTQIS